MSLNGSHSDETGVKIGSMVSMNSQALDSEEMKKCDFMSGIEGKDHLIIPSDDQIEKSVRVNQDGSMTVEMKVRLTIKQEEVIHWTTTVTRACSNSQDLAAFSQPVSSYNSPDNKDNNNNRPRETNIDGYESKGENTQTLQNHCGSANSEAVVNPKPCFRRLPTPGPRRARRKETSMENTKSLSQTEVQESTVGAYSYEEHTVTFVSHSSSSSTRPIPRPRKKNLRETKHNKTHASLSGMAEVLQLHNNGKEITETVMRIHQSQDTCGNCFAKTWTDEDDRFEQKKPHSTESGPQSSSNTCDTNLTKPSESSGSGNARNNEVLSLLSGQSDLSQTISNNASFFTDYENQARCESPNKEVERSTKKDSENKRVLSKKTKMAQKSDKHMFLKSTVTDKKQKGSVPDFLKDLKNSDSPESHSCTESGKYGKEVKKRKKGQSTEKVKACQTDMLSPHMREKLDIIPLSHPGPLKILTKQQSVNGSKKKSPKENKELSESVSMPVLHSAPCNVHQYVENWLEKIHPESVPYMDELNPHESIAIFQIESDFSDMSEMRSEVDKDNLVENSASVKGSQNLSRSWKSIPSVKMQTAEREIGTRKNKSSDDLISKLSDAGGGTSPNTQLNPRSSMKDILEQLCLSIQLISRASSHSHPSSLKKKNKSCSLPDFSSLLASVFGSPSKALLSFLTVMTLRDGIGNSANEDSGSSDANNSGSDPEALQVMQSIQKLASIEDEEELKASLASLHSSTSARLKKSWRDFQEQNSIKENPPLSPRQSEQEFVLEINSGEEGQDKGHIFGIREVMDELNMCESLRREISSLVRNELTHLDRAEPTKEHSGHENKTTNIACENQSSAHKPANKELAMEEVVKNVQIENMSHQKGLVAHITEIVGYVKTVQERYGDNELSKADLCEEKHEMMDNVQMIEGKYTEDEIRQVDEFHMTDYSPTNLEDKVEWRETVGCCVQSKSELLSPTSEIEAKDSRSNSEAIGNSVSKNGDCTEGCGINSKEKDIYCEAQTPNNDTIQAEGNNAIHKDATSEASDFSVDEFDPCSNDKVDRNNDHEETMCGTSECETPAAKPHYFSMSDEEDEHHKGREAVDELDLQTLEEESVRKPLSHPETVEYDGKQSNALDTGKDVDPESPHCYVDNPSIKDFPRRDSCKSEEIHKAQSEDSAAIEEAGMDHDCHCVRPAVFPQQLLDFVNFALASSALIFTYDSNGCLRIEPDRCKNASTTLSKSNVDNQYARGCLPSPNTSDLSDYRPDTSDSGGDLSQVSTALLTESGEDEAERLFINQGSMKQSSENISTKAKTLDNGSKKPHPGTKQRASSTIKRIDSLSSFPDSVVNSTSQDPVYCNSSDSVGNSELAQCLAFHAEIDSGEGILIDKGRWLLKENHLIRKSPPVPMGMYENMDTTSVDTGQEHTSEDASCIPCGRKQSPLAVISSSELEDMAKPSTPKCAYFNMAHSSDSDPFLDNQSVTSNKGRGYTRKSQEVSPLGETSKTIAKKNGSLPSFGSVEFKVAARKVHPEDDATSRVVEKSARSQCTTQHEEESAEGLSFRCGQHCPIL